MSLGSRIEKRAVAVIVARLASTPREPLHFLYPDLVRNSSTTASQPTRYRNGRAPKTFLRRNTAPATILPIAATEFRVEAPQGADSVENKEGIGTDQTVHDQNHGAKSAEEEGASEALRFSMARRFPKHLGNASITPAFKMRIDRSFRLQRQAEERRRLRAAARKIYQKRNYEPDWRVILGELRGTTLQHDQWFDKRVSLTVPESAYERLFASIDDNMWDIAEKHDCSVALGDRDPYTLQNEFILSGSAIAISKTAAEAMNIAPGSKLRRVVQENLSPNPKPTALQLTEDSDDQDSRGLLIRFFKISSGGTVPVTRADKIPRPSKWTTHEFANYVEKLTSIHMPNHVHHLLYRKGEQHVKTVVGILREIFTDPECKSSLSRMAFKMALDYFVKTSNIADARAIFVLMDMMEIEMDPGIFNILLRGAAKNDDLHNFQLVLHLMLRRGISPNGRTWTAFLMANHDFRIKRYIMSEMKAKGLLAHPYIMRRVCQEFVIQEVNASVDLGLNQEDFLNHMDSQYGNNWLTADNGNRVLHALGARGLISRCWEFLQAMNNRSVRIESVSVNTVLNHCKQQTNISGAIEIMRLLPSLTEFEPDQFTYHTLFEMAWRARRYNIARVVWKYACLNAATTRRMRVLVTQSLIYAAQNPGPKSSEMQIWNQQAGLVITDGVFDHPSPNWDGPSYGQRFVLHPEKTVSRKEIFEAASRHVERDFEVFNSWAPRQPFGDILVQALELDLRWHETRVCTGEETRFDWKIEEAIVVPLYKLEGVGKGKIRMDWR